jgi:hypothetical protein
VDVAVPLGALADQAQAGTQEVAQAAAFAGVGIGGGEVAALEQTSEGLGILAIALGLAAVDGFQGPGVAEDEGEAVVAAGVGQPVPGMDALAADQQAVGERGDGAQEGLGLSGEVAAEAGLAVGVEDDQVQGPGVQVNAGVKSGVGRRLERTHGEGLQVEVRWRRLGALSIFAYESLHEYPGAAPDRGGM